MLLGVAFHRHPKNLVIGSISVTFTFQDNTSCIFFVHPRCLTKQSNALIEIETTRPVCLELYKDNKDLGRFMMRYSGSTIGAGVVTEVGI